MCVRAQTTCHVVFRLCSLMYVSGGGDAQRPKWFFEWEALMAVHRPDVMTVSTMGVLLSPLAKAVAVGPIRWNWKRPNVVEGRLDVQTEVGVCPAGRLSIGILTARPDTVRLQYIVNDVAVFRVCVNDKHNGWSPMTHSHTYIPATGRERDEKLPDFCPIPRGPSVARGTYKRSLTEFAALVSVDLPPGYWSEPERSH